MSMNDLAFPLNKAVGLRQGPQGLSWLRSGGRQRNAVYRDINQRQILHVVGLQLRVFKLEVQVLQRDVADSGLASVGLNRAERAETPFDVGEGYAMHNGLRGSFVLQIKELFP